MNKTTTILVIILVLVLAGGAVWALMTMNNLNETRENFTNAQEQIKALTSELDQTKGKLAVNEVTLATMEIELTGTSAELEEIQLNLARTSQKLDSTSSELAENKIELTETETELSDVKMQLATTVSELSSTRTEATNAKSQLAEVQTELTSVKSELTTTENELTAAKSELVTTKDRMTTMDETLKGLGITISKSAECTDSSLADSPQAKNPTWLELRTFLLQDTTEQHEYISGVYDCSEYSRDVHNNAEAAGIRAAVVHTWFTNDIVGHALNAFLTSDYGLVYVDCTEDPDKIARVVKGEALVAIEPTYITQYNIRDKYWWGSMWRSVGHLYMVEGGFVQSIEIFW